MANMTDWIMCGLTAIYVIATIKILFSNSKSAKAAEKQIEESKLIQKQNVALQLLNQRISIYNILSEWIEYAKVICENNMHFNDSLKILYSFIFNNPKDVELEDLKFQISQVKQAMEKSDIKEEQVKLLQEQLDVLSTNLFLRKFYMMKQDAKVVELAEICFDVDYQTIKKFVDAYMEMTLYIDHEMRNNKEWPYTTQLKIATNRIIDEGILEKMKEEMKNAKNLSKDA